MATHGGMARLVARRSARRGERPSHAASPLPSQALKTPTAPIPRRNRRRRGFESLKPRDYSAAKAASGISIGEASSSVSTFAECSTCGSTLRAYQRAEAFLPS